MLTYTAKNAQHPLVIPCARSPGRFLFRGRPRSWTGLHPSSVLVLKRAFVWSFHRPCLKAMHRMRSRVQHSGSRRRRRRGGGETFGRAGGREDVAQRAARSAQRTATRRVRRSGMASHGVEGWRRQTRRKAYLEAVPTHRISQVQPAGCSRLAGFSNSVTSALGVESRRQQGTAVLQCCSTAASQTKRSSGGPPISQGVVGAAW